MIISNRLVDLARNLAPGVEGVNYSNEDSSKTFRRPPHPGRLLLGRSAIARLVKTICAIKLTVATYPAGPATVLVVMATI